MHNTCTYLCGINLNASQIVWIALKDYKKLFYCFFICLDLTIKYNLCCIYHPNSENRFRTFLREASHTFFLLKEVHDKNTKTTILYIEILKRKIGSLFFWPRMNLFHVVINLCWFFLCQLFSKGEFFFNFVWCKTEKAKDFAHIFPQSCRK